MKQAEDACPGFWSLEDHDILLLPSITVSFYENRKLSSIHEERHLVFLNLLKNKNSRIIFVMSSALDADIIKYRLDVYKKAYDDPTAADRLFLLSVDDTSKRPLTEKILGNAKLIKEIQRHIRDPEKAIMLSYICTERDLELRNKIGIPRWFGASCQKWGTKSGSRQTFMESGVPIAEGLMEPIYTLDELEGAILQLWRKTRAARMIVKTDDGSGGHGNVVLDFGGVKEADMENVKRVLRESVKKAGTFFEQFEEFVEKSGVIVEEMMDPPREDFTQTTPSVQLYIKDSNDVQILSSHEQVVDGCIYLGCRYPANKHYLEFITQQSKQIGKSLAAKGVRGFLGVDFLANQMEANPEGEWDIRALEINLRLCATTFSYFLLLTVINKEEDVPKKHYVMLDELHINPKIQCFRQLDAALSQSGLAFDAKTGRGVLLVTCGRITSHREASVCVVADSRREVDALLDRFLAEFADEERKHFVHSRSNTPVLPSRLGDARIENAKEDIEREVRAIKVNEQGVAI